MSLFWLKAVPWSTLLANAPLIVDGAKKLASLVRTNPPAAAQSSALGTNAGAPADLAALNTRLQALERQQADTAELLRALADNNAEMARALEAVGQRSKLTLRVAAAAAIGVVVLIVWMLAR